MLSENDLKFFSENISFWSSLSDKEKKEIQELSYRTGYKSSELIYSSDSECLGLVLVLSGQLRAFIDSDEGKQITLYRLLDYDVCIMSASCKIKNFNAAISIKSEKPTQVIILPMTLFKTLDETNIAVKDFALEHMSASFSEVMWVFEQYVFGSAAKRLACFLREHSSLEGTDTLELTHEFIANDIGTAREVVTRLLKHFASDGIVSLARGSIKIENRKKLESFCS